MCQLAADSDLSPYDIANRYLELGEIKEAFELSHALDLNLSHLFSRLTELCIRARNGEQMASLLHWFLSLSRDPQFPLAPLSLGHVRPALTRQKTGCGEHSDGTSNYTTQSRVFS